MRGGKKIRQIKITLKLFAERETKIQQNYKELHIQKESQVKLLNEESELRSKYEKECEKLKKISDKNGQLKEQFKIYSDLLKNVLPDSEYNSEFFDKMLTYEKPPASDSHEMIRKPETVEIKPKGKRGRPSLKDSAIKNTQSVKHPLETRSSTDSPKKKRGRSSLGYTTVVNKLIMGSR